MKRIFVLLGLTLIIGGAVIGVVFGSKNNDMFMIESQHLTKEEILSGKEFSAVSGSVGNKVTVNEDGSVDLEDVLSASKPIHSNIKGGGDTVLVSEIETGVTNKVILTSDKQGNILKIENIDTYNQEKVERYEDENGNEIKLKDILIENSKLDAPGLVYSLKEDGNFLIQSMIFDLSDLSKEELEKTQGTEVMLNGKVNLDKYVQLLEIFEYKIVK